MRWVPRQRAWPLLALAGTASSGSKGTWTVFKLDTTGATTGSFVAFGHPLEFANAKCFSFYYRAMQVPNIFALRVADNSPTRVAVLETASLPAGDIKSTKLKGTAIGGRAGLCCRRLRCPVGGLALRDSSSG